MNQPLQGWDLATWRVTQSKSGLAANVVAIVEVAGIINSEAFNNRVKNLVSIYPTLSMAVSDSEPTHLYSIPDFSILPYISKSTDSVSESATRLANLNIGPNECLWRIEMIYREGKTFILCAINHAIADGNTAMLLMQYLFDNPREMSFKTKSGEGKSDFFNDIKNGVSEFVGRVTKDPVGLARDISEMAQSITRLMALNTADRDSNETSELAAKFYKIDKRQLNNLTQGNQISSHDAMVALIVGALQRYHQKKSNSGESLLVNVPVAMNINDLAANKIVVARIDFPFAITPASQLMKMSREKLRNWRKEPSLKIANSLINASQLIPIDLIVRNLRSSDATISTLLGDSQPKRMFGFEVKGIWPLLAPIGAGLNFTSVTLNGYVYIGLCLDHQVISDRQRWQLAFEASALEIFNQKLFEQIFE